MSEFDRVEFIKTIPGIKQIDPYLNLSAVIEIKRSLHSSGYYKNEIWHINDASIVNLILKAQGLTPQRTIKSRTNLKKPRIYIIE